MNTNKIKVVLAAVLVAAMTGCATYPEHVSLSDGQKNAIKENNARAAVAVTYDGRLVAVDENGKSLRRCTIEPDGKGELKQCVGLQKGATVQSVRNITLIKSKINPDCWTFINPVLGFAEEVCW